MKSKPNGALRCKNNDFMKVYCAVISSKVCLLRLDAESRFTVQKYANLHSVDNIVGSIDVEEFLCKRHLVSCYNRRQMAAS
ncbi:hypothetical protein T4D_1428 [Trichinella pseudospiralis]|uniref:Uncharacterized protein n=1 Tax=Trichinella pseudospiralis TaxID=6337 RepID=A0A0V1FW03_TRIPS|nr:hypothetical protein T4D_1428 [Trichinella pseudospiralis]